MHPATKRRLVMKEQLTELQANAVLKAIDDAIEKGPWDESNFLRVIGKNLRGIRDNLADKMAASTKTSSNAFQSDQVLGIADGLQEVFIALYSSEGNQLSSWERILANLQRQMISRPIYAKEDNVKHLIKSKENKINEAYVSIFIHKDDILTLSDEKISRDKFGKPLLSLKDRSLNLDNIHHFVHLSGTYRYLKGRLIKLPL